MLVARPSTPNPRLRQQPTGYVSLSHWLVASLFLCLSVCSSICVLFAWFLCRLHIIHIPVACGHFVFCTYQFSAGRPCPSVGELPCRSEHRPSPSVGVSILPLDALPSISCRTCHGALDKAGFRHPLFSKQVWTKINTKSGAS